MQRFKLFGGIGIHAEVGPVTGRAVQRRRLALLALLAASRSTGASRDKLIALLWPEATAENGRSFLSDSIYRINQALGGDAILSAGDELRLDEERLPSDLAEFCDALAGGELERAVALYAGPFADGFFLPDAPELERWIERERERLAREYGRALERLAARADEAGDRTAAVGWWRRAAAHDPYNGRVALHLMQALESAGERPAALRHAQVHETLLREELELEPDPGILRYAEELRMASRAPGTVGEREMKRSVAPEAANGLERETNPARSAAGEATAAPRAEPSAKGKTVAGAPPSSRVGTEAPMVWRRTRARRLAALAVVAVAAALIVLVLFWRERASTLPDVAAPAIRSVAVLPFANLGADPSDQYIGDGLAEELIVTLGRIEGLRVASRASSFGVRGTGAGAPDIGRRLDVESLIDGSVRRSGRRLRITIQVVRTADGRLTWTESYDRESGDLLDVQREIARAVTAALTGRAAAGVATAALDDDDVGAEAYDLYLRGRHAWHLRTRAGLLGAIAHFEAAVASAPRYARASAGLADAYAVAAFYDYVPPRIAYPRAEAAALRAAELDPALAAPHATLAYVRTYYHLDWQGAEEGFRRALALDPDYSTAHQWYANLLTVSGRFEEAEREMRRAQETDPLSLIANAALCWTLYHARRTEEALERCRGTLALNPDYELAHLWGGWTLEALGRRDEAGAWVGRAVKLSGESLLTRLALAHVLAGAGTPASRDSAFAIVREAERMARDGEYVPSYEIGKVRLALGEREQAISWLRRAVEERSHSRAFFRIDPQLDSLREDPRFARLAATLPSAGGATP